MCVGVCVCVCVCVWEKEKERESESNSLVIREIVTLYNISNTNILQSYLEYFLVIS